jgi:hypothetical protein
VVRIVFGRRMLLTLLLFGWMAGVDAGGRGCLPASRRDGFHAGAASSHQSACVRRGQLGMHAVQGLGTPADDAAAAAIGDPVAVGRAGLVGLTAATILVIYWTHMPARLNQAQQAEAEATGTGPYDLVHDRARGA